MAAALILLAIVLFLLLLFFISAVKVAREYERGVVFRLGRLLDPPKGPGLFLLIAIIDEATSPWGIKVSIVEVKDVEIPAVMQRAMARQAEAERERRAKVINAE